MQSGASRSAHRPVTRVHRSQGALRCFRARAYTDGRGFQSSDASPFPKRAAVAAPTGYWCRHRRSAYHDRAGRRRPAARDRCRCHAEPVRNRDDDGATNLHRDDHLVSRDINRADDHDHDINGADHYDHDPNGADDDSQHVHSAEPDHNYDHHHNDAGDRHRPDAGVGQFHIRQQRLVVLDPAGLTRPLPSPLVAHGRPALPAAAQT